jgi:hypothetical protein
VADNSFPFNVRIKSEWSCTSSPCICLQGAYRKDCTLAMLFKFIAANVLDADVPSVHFASILCGLIITVIIFYYLFQITGNT